MLEPDESPAAFSAWGRPDGLSRARRVGASVQRDSGPWSETVISLLRHLRAVGFSAAPRVLGSGFSENGDESLEFIEGACPEEPFEWSPEAAFALGEMLKELHHASASFQPGPGAVFRPWFGRELPSSQVVYGHCDAGPYNLITRDGMPVAFIDWEFAGPTDIRWELAQTVWLNAQLHEVGFSDPTVQLPDLASRAAVVRGILDGYGYPADLRAEFVDYLLQFIVFSARAKGRKYGITPTHSVGHVDGQPVAWDVLWRVQSAAWVIRHKQDLAMAAR